MVVENFIHKRGDKISKLSKSLQALKIKGLRNY